MVQTKSDKLKLIKLLKQKQIIQARTNHLDFMKYCWMEGRTNPFIQGFHTIKICEAIDQALIDYINENNVMDVYLGWLKDKLYIYKVMRG